MLTIQLLIFDDSQCESVFLALEYQKWFKLGPFSGPNT